MKSRYKNFLIIFIKKWTMRDIPIVFVFKILISLVISFSVFGEQLELSERDKKALGNEPMLAYQRYPEIVMMIATFKDRPGAQGTGYFIDSNILVTAAHSGADAELYFIDPLNYNLVGPLEILVRDRKNDVTILRTENYTAKSFFSIDVEFKNEIKLSDKLISAGFPKGRFRVREGIFSGQQQNQFMMIEGMRARVGHSGGPVLSESRALVGMLLGGGNTCDRPTSSTDQREEKSREELNCKDIARFVPINRIRDVFKSLHN